ncbi:gas vesicle protein [Pontibacter ummariensis]|uniref:Gas vesicle protein n=2 Tax=Pontibacter ummariensis TaxID=1610492 RepID=A0A239GA57_9BACT|nr:gas vesicle protein [Pontibacter ummariensis]SNS65323.1 Gas vesicle protein [Pontibacter ummariensis]
MDSFKTDNFNLQLGSFNKDNGKILLATLAGISAGVVAGILMAPSSGRATRDSLTRSLSKAGDELNGTVKRWTESLKLGGGQRSDDELVLHGSWEDVKSQLRRNYDDLTDEDLDYQQGKEHELYDRLQRRLGKTKDEIVRLISEL